MPLIIGVLLSACFVICISVWSARAASSLVSGEPKGPNVKTQIPGPKSKELMNELSQIQVNWNFKFL
jgi:hypothetical protein